MGRGREIKLHIGELALLTIGARKVLVKLKGRKPAGYLIT